MQEKLSDHNPVIFHIEDLNDIEDQEDTMKMLRFSLLIVRTKYYQIIRKKLILWDCLYFDGFTPQLTMLY